jgi:putative hydrolase of HD superfamily
MLLSLKEHLDTGSSDAARWIPYVRNRLKSEEAKALADAILKEHWASWWMKQLLGENYQ